MTDLATTLDAAHVPDVISRLAYLVAPVKSEGIGSDTRLVEDLGFHSVALAELGFTIEDLFEIDALPQEETMSVRTVGDMIKLADAELGRSAAKPPTIEHLQAIFSRFGVEWSPPA